MRRVEYRPEGPVAKDEKLAEVPGQALDAGLRPIGSDSLQELLQETHLVSLLQLLSHVLHVEGSAVHCGHAG